MESASATSETYPTRPDDACFWLYSSGSTGRPKGARARADQPGADGGAYRAGCSWESPGTTSVYSAAKLFFAYGLGNALTFPLAVGATAMLFAGTAEAGGNQCHPARAAADALLRCADVVQFVCWRRLICRARRARPCGCAVRPVRHCRSRLAGRGREHTGVEIIDGVGSTEMLHCFRLEPSRCGAVWNVGVTGARLSSAAGG